MPIAKVFAHLHPVFIHFPIALLVVGMVFEWIALLRRGTAYGATTRAVLIFALLGGVLAILSGLGLEGDDDVGLIDEGAVALIDRHKTFAIVAGCAALVSVVLGEIQRRRPHGATKGLYLLVLHASVAAVAYAAALGGQSKWGPDWLPW